MIDIHCHILPEVDDGSRSLNESIEMAMIAKEQGITKIVNTSHYHPDFRYKKGEELLKELEDFNNVLKENMIDIEVLIGNEIYYTKDLIKEIDELQLFIVRFRYPIEWESFDDKKVDIAFAIIAPEEKGQEKYLVFLSRLARKLVDEKFIADFRNCRSTEAVYQYVKNELE